jgi:transcriptional regulator with XRE-family HTH domain
MASDSGASLAYTRERAEILLDFGLTVRRLRKAANHSQRSLGQVARLHDTEIGLLERGRRGPGLLTILILADALSVEPWYLLDGLPVPKERRTSLYAKGGPE